MCCSKHRAAARAAAMAAGARSAGGASAPAERSTSEIMFEYVGSGAGTTVRGPATGRVYRFPAPGDRVRVDARDRPGLAAMPVLRWVR